MVRSHGDLQEGAEVEMVVLLQLRPSGDSLWCVVLSWGSKYLNSNTI